jgi:eukaryotic-like serine/threonine-protein kinase
MDSVRWSRIQDIFHGAADLPSTEQRAYLEKACAGDDSLKSEVQALLSEDARGSSLLDRDVGLIAHEVLEDSASRPVPFKEIGPYRMERLLGEGGMGVVYLAERSDLRSRVAIKILRDAWVSPARRERFLSEQRTLARLNHPSIARLYDADTLPDGTPFFVMEYVEGVSLVDYCNKAGNSIEERLRLFRAVCDAVQYAHGQAVIHRDLKPSNILVKKDGTVRLLDFGIAKQIENLNAPAEQTRTSPWLMTPAYASPEQIRVEPVGIQSDAYSLGVVLYELLAGRLPFDLSEKTPAEVALTIAEQEPVKPSAAVKLASASQGANPHALSTSKTSWADLDVLCLTAMHKDIQRRYSSVEALIRDIDHYLNREPLEARSDSLTYRMRKFVSRNRSAVSAGVVVSAVIVSLVVFYTWRLTKARNAALAEAARTHRIQRFMQNLFQGGEDAIGPTDDLRVVTLLDRGVQEARTLDTDPPVQAELYATLGNIYDQLGKFDSADSLLNLALEKRKSIYGADSAPVAESLVALGVLKNDEAKFAEAEQLIDDGLAMSKRHLPPNHPQVAQAISSLGKVQISRGRYAEAVPNLEEALRIQSAPGGVPADRLTTMTELANAQFYLGQYAESYSLNQSALELDRQLFGERHPNVAEDLINLGAIEFEWGRYAEAEKYDRQALDIIQAWFGKDHPESSSLMTILGRVLVAEGKLDEADHLLRASLQIQERDYGLWHPRVASTVNELGKVALQQGKLDESEADFRRAAEIWKKAYNGNHYYIGTALANLGNVDMERHHYAQAEAYYHDALQMYEGTLPPEHKLVGIGRISLGRALLREKRYADAQAETLTGYKILVKINLPSQKWLQSALEDSVEEYDALNQPDQAAKFRAELALVKGKGAGTAKKE